MKQLREAVKKEKGGMDHEAIARSMKSPDDLHKVMAHFYHQAHHEFVDETELRQECRTDPKGLGHSVAEIGHEMHHDTFRDVEHHIHKLAKHYAKQY